MKTKTLLLAVVFTSAIIHHPSSISFAQAPNWAWAQSAGGTFNDEGFSVSTDASGNVFVTGGFYSPAITFGTTTLTNASAGGSDMFLVKYDSAGTVLWAKSAGGISSDYGYSVSTDAGGNVFVTGYFKSPTITFGTTALTNADNTGNTDDIFIVKYDNSGTVLWAKSAGGTSLDFGNSVSTDAGGNVFVTGYFYSNTITFGTTALTNAGGSDMFIVKYDAAGTVLWAQSAGGTSSDYGNSISTDSGGNVFVTGYFASPSITFGTTTLTGAGGSDIFIVKYDNSGTVLWAKSEGGTSGDAGSSVSTDAGGNVFVTGSFWSDTITFGTTALTNAGNNDIFIVKYDNSGTVLWAKSAGGIDDDDGNSVSTDAGGNAFVTGYFESDSITFGTTTLTNTNTGGYSDIFIVKYDNSGTVLWAKSAGGTFWDAGNSVFTDAAGNVYITGRFDGPTITFGTTTLTNAGAGYPDMFIVKYDGSGTVLWARAAGGTSYGWGSSVSIPQGGTDVFVTGLFYSPTITFGTTTLTNADTIGTTYDIFIAKLGAASGIESPLTTENEISIYPNPTSGKFTIQLATGNWQLASSQKQVASIEIYNVLGEKVTQSVIPSGTRNLSVDLSEAPDGIYFICIKAEEGIVTKKFIVSK